jgi:hypothetical protein
VLHTAIGDHDRYATGRKGPRRTDTLASPGLQNANANTFLPGVLVAVWTDAATGCVDPTGWNLLLSFRSVTRLTTWVPWLCVPALRRVCRLSLEPAIHPLDCRGWQHNILGSAMQRVSRRSFRSGPPITKPSFRDVTTRRTERGPQDVVGWSRAVGRKPGLSARERKALSEADDVVDCQSQDAGGDGRLK